MALVKFYSLDIASIPLSNRKPLKLFIPEVFKIESKRLLSLTYIFTTDDKMLEINQKYLGHDSFTDVVTFDLSNVSVEIVGEIYISIERVKDNARIYRTAFQQELRRVVLHGALHLCGYRDKKKSEITIMRQKEERYLCLFKAKIDSST